MAVTFLKLFCSTLMESFKNIELMYSADFQSGTYQYFKLETSLRCGSMSASSTFIQEKQKLVTETCVSCLPKKVTLKMYV